MNITKIRNALETLGTSPSEMRDRAVKTEALRLSKNYIDAFEISGKLPPERIKLLRQERKDFKAKLADEDFWFRGNDNGELEETIDEKGRVRDSGEEKNMGITERATLALERIADKQEEKDLEESLLDAVDTGRSPKVTHTYDYLPDRTETKVELTSKNLLATVSREEGIVGSNDPTKINQYQSPEAVWNKRRLELKTAGKPTKDDEGELLAAVTK